MTGGDSAEMTKARASLLGSNGLSASGAESTAAASASGKLTLETPAMRSAHRSSESAWSGSHATFAARAEAARMRAATPMPAAHIVSVALCLCPCDSLPSIVASANPPTQPHAYTSATNTNAPPQPFTSASLLSSSSFSFSFSHSFFFFVPFSPPSPRTSQTRLGLSLSHSTAGSARSPNMASATATSGRPPIMTASAGKKTAMLTKRTREVKM
mmetsp:Transcript_12869/g.42478  ORF Transcript_12869/g.42478 Transcript_12869/m.42478 type:complete len:214 (+) Transcript_12869:227-868(+)